MKRIDSYIVEKLKIGKSYDNYNYHPKDHNELLLLIDRLIKERGVHADLNDIDVSAIENMNAIFGNQNVRNIRFNGDISKWDMSNVKIMDRMFHSSSFTGKYGDIDSWDVSNVQSMSMMFSHSKFNGNISHWNTSNVEDMSFMFSNSKFKGDINNWDISNVKNMQHVFQYSPLKNHLPKWYKEK